MSAIVTLEPNTPSSSGALPDLVKSGRLNLLNSMKNFGSSTASTHISPLVRLPNSLRHLSHANAADVPQCGVAVLGAGLTGYVMALHSA
jgi:hypothetical protein